MQRQSEHRTDVVGMTPPAPSPSASRLTRVGDDDRKQVADLLQAHYVAGRLNADELAERVEQALGARIRADLDSLLADLPAAQTPAGEAAPRPRVSSKHPTELHQQLSCQGGEKSFRAHATSYLLVMALLVTIWLLTTPGGYFWPVWPMLGWGIGLASHGLAARGSDKGPPIAASR